MQATTGWNAGGSVCMVALLLALGAAPAVAAAGAEAAPAGSTEGASSYRDLAVGLTEDGHPYLGEPDAPVTVEEFSDYLCPFCERHHRQTLPGLLEKYVRPGRVRYVFRDFPIASLHPQAPQAAAAAKCVAEQGAARFWAMHDRLFESRARWASAASADVLLGELATAAGADMTAYAACMQAGRASARVASDIAAGEELGFNGTPSFRFVARAGGEAHSFSGAYPLEKFESWIDAMLAGEPPPEPPTPPPPKLPFWASPEGLAPDPARPGFTTAGDPYKGDPGAQLVVVEFSDFQCPACRKHALDTEPLLDEKFIATGKVLWVFKNLPLAMHPNAPAAAAAAECAGGQGRFWEMAHRLFDRADTWSEGDPDRAILALAQELGLAEPDFRSCYGGRPALERVLKDMYDSRGVATTTPTFILIQGGRGMVVNGAQQADVFADMIQRALERAAEGRD